MDAGGTDKVIVGRYLRRDQAEDRSLVLQAMGVRYWIIPEEGLYLLLVNPWEAETAVRELADYEAERRAEREEMLQEGHELLPPRERVPLFSLFIYVWVMIGFFLLQTEAPAGWGARGAADSTLILKGEWWRVVTALTLHADSGHLVANIGVGLLFTGALLPWLGSGWTWLGFVLSGAMGNAINAWGFRGDNHVSIGASTAVFGALGMLVGWQVFALLQQRGSGSGSRKLRLRELGIPVAAGLALLAYLGTGGGMEESRVDLTAHLFGMLSGVLIGAVLAWARLPQRTSPGMQKVLAVVALLIPCVTWLLAWG